MLNSLSHYIQRIKRHVSQYQYVSFTEKNVLLTPLNTPRLRKKYLHQLLILNIKFRDVHRHVMFIFGSNQNDSKINLHFKSVIICARPYINIQRRHFEMPKHQSNARTFFFTVVPDQILFIACIYRLYILQYNIMDCDIKIHWSYIRSYCHQQQLYYGIPWVC